MSNSSFAFGIGIGTKNSRGEWLEVYFQQPLVELAAELTNAVSAVIGDNALSELDTGGWEALAEQLDAAGYDSQAQLATAAANSQRPAVLVLLKADVAPSSVPEAYLKLQLLSHRLVKPHALNISGIFGCLANIAWTNRGAIDLADLPQRQLEARCNGETLSVDSVDKFPKMTDYVVPTGVRIADTARVRLGAYIGEGTTIMHEGFVNFNAGTDGPGMIEGRISAGVFVGKGSDLGGGCSTMGTLSGGNDVVISIGESCLIGANAGVGIPLGDRCTIEAGLYVTGASKVSVLDDSGTEVTVVKAAELAGQSDLLFRRNSRTGEMQCLANKSAIVLNEALHVNN